MKNTTIFLKPYLKSLWAICFLLCFASCGEHLQSLELAQNQFNKGAKLELEQLFSPSVPPTGEKPRSFYESAYQAAKKGLQNKAGLDKDSVGVQLFIIKALCEWKLGHFDLVDASIADADAANKQLERKGIALPRDRVLIKALPPLVEAGKIKRELDTLLAKKAQTSAAAARQNFSKLIFDPLSHKGRLELAIKGLNNLDPGSNQELNISLTQSTLAAFKIWSDGYDYLRSCNVNDRSLSDDEKMKLEDARLKERSQGYGADGEKVIQKLERLLENQDQAKQIIDFWRKTLGIFKR
jgi:hypothetical protein